MEDCNKLSQSQPNLNKAQKEAVLHYDGPLLILAGAGTGKTKVLTSRIINIINSYLAAPSEILAVTFTNKAAFEMRQRIFTEIGDEANNIWSGTFHSIASRILKRHPEIVGLKADFTIIDYDDQLRLIKQITNDLGIDIKNYPAKNYIYQIERFKDKALRAQDIMAKNYHSHNLPNLAEIYEIYQNRLQDLNLVDFGDLLLYNLEIFQKSPQTLEYYQKKFHYILVDEYQDTNNCQYLWLLQLAKGGKQNICAVGDDDQSIYSWRGAEIKNILRFEKDFKNTKIIRLEQNYRSTTNILKCASHIIKNNQDRHDKTLWSESELGDKIKLYSFFDEKSEASEIANIIDNLQAKLKLNNIAILVRAGYQTRAFEEAFINISLPYKIIGGLRFFERREIRDIIAYLRIIANINDDLALQRIINLPKRGVGNVTLQKLSQKSRDSKSSLFATIKREIADGLMKGKSKIALTKFVQDILDWQEQIKNNLTLADLTKDILEKTGYLAMWHNDKTPEAKGRVENLKEFVSSLEDFANLEQFLEHVSLVMSNDSENEINDMVNIMTVHGAKGLEFDTVFIPGLEEGVFPSSRSIEERNGLEEERRLLYVAITRARKNLYLSHAQNRLVFGNFQHSLPSRFLQELPQDVIELENNLDFNVSRETFSHNSGKNFVSRETNNYLSQDEQNFLHKRVFHQKFGYGKVLKVRDDKLEIKFEKTGLKTIIKKFVQLA